MMEAVLKEFLDNLWLYLSMPMISGMVGYVTNVIAIKMMFQPLEFVGKPPLLGWQGIIPRRAAKMAAISVETITSHLITQEEIFARLDADKVADVLEPALNDIVDDIVDQVMLEYEPGFWEAMPQMVKRKIYQRVKRDAPRLINDIMGQLKLNISQMYDLEDMVVTKLCQDKGLLNKIFLEVGAAEFRFIGRSGFYFGLMFGLVQMLVWLCFQQGWLLPAFGLLVGYATNAIALKMIFSPKEPVRIGPIAFQGLFMKRQQEVARDYGRLVSSYVLTPANIVEGILKGPYSDKVFDMIGRHVQRAVDEQTTIAKPLVTFAVGTQTYRDMKASAVQRVIAKLPTTLKHIEAYADEALDLENTLSTRLQSLKPDEFEAMLRPAFEQDEWILITVGAALGLAVGVFQLLVMFA
ncbi:DUF445 family protein [Marinobacter sp. SS21]|uniref:DUF445 family protein n=1 Tax=Marinobacter sp. SS21 TaxID=2979460 RepID=UPI00232A9A2B|nr:DUF445 family protein [Marinobacter sp. SS21]MDC0662994.1 DUF445 family protein [Marinobacter sp. SS21]